MKKSISYWQTAGFVFTAVLGTFLHFFFDLTGGSWGAGLVSAVNESIWEHTKLLFYPMLLFALGEYRCWGRETESFWCVKLIGALTGLLLIPVLFYTYTGALGVWADWFNVTIFFLVAGAVYWLETKLLQQGFACKMDPRLAFALLCLLAGVYILFTFAPPRVPLFQDPLSGTFGFQG